MKTRSYRQRELEFKLRAGGFQFGQLVVLYRDAIRRLGYPEGHGPALMVEIILLDEEERGLIRCDSEQSEKDRAV